MKTALKLPPVKKASARKGLRYERAVGERLKLEARKGHLPGPITKGLFDSSGCRYHQPDFWIESKELVLLFECKLTFTEDGIDQLYRYAPMLASLYGKPVVLVQVCRNLTPAARRFEMLCSLAEASVQLTEGPFIWHCLFPKEPNL